MMIRYYSNEEGWTFYTNVRRITASNGNELYMVDRKDEKPLFFELNQVTVDTEKKDFLGAGVFTGDMLEHMETGEEYLLFYNNDDLGYIDSNDDFILIEDGFIENSILIGNMMEDTSLKLKFDRSFQRYKRKHYENISIYTAVHGQSRGYGPAAYSYTVLNKSDDSIPMTTRGLIGPADINIANIVAITKAIECVEPHDMQQITVFSYSNFLVDIINKGMLQYWDSVGWVTKDGSQVRNARYLRDLKNAIVGKNVVMKEFKRDNYEFVKEKRSAEEYYKANVNGGVY